MIIIQLTPEQYDDLLDMCCSVILPEDIRNEIEREIPESEKGL